MPDPSASLTGGASSSSSSSTSSSSSSSGGASRGTIFISGYWPPTNIEQPNGMLNQFRSATRGQLGEYVIENYERRNYRVVTLATEFPGQAGPDFGGGMGFWQVDYMLTSYTFWNMMSKYNPIAVMTTSRSGPHRRWILERGSRNLPQTGMNSWLIPAGGFNTGRPPYIGGSNIDPAAAPGLPNAGRAPEARNPPDATRVQNTALSGIPGVIAPMGLQTRIINVLTANIPAANLTAEQNPAVQGTFPDNYVSAFAGYHAVWYNRWANNTCLAGWHTHVGSQITVPTATTAIRLQLLELMRWLTP